MAIDDLIPKDIDMIYAAKLMTPYLEVEYKQPSELAGNAWYVINHLPTVVLAGLIDSSAWLAERVSLLANPKKRKERKKDNAEEQAIFQSIQDAFNRKEAAIMQKLSESGVRMPQGRQAYDFAQYISTDLGFLLEYWQGSDTQKSGVEFMGVSNMPRLPVSEIRMPKASFERMLENLISDAGYSMSEQGYKINPNFNEKAKGLLLQETYSRLQQGKRFNLLEAVNVGMDEQQRVYLRNLLIR